MLSQSRKPVCLSLMSSDMPIWSHLETSATVYQKMPDQFHVLLTEPAINGHPCSYSAATSGATSPLPRRLADDTQGPPRLLWIELSPYRVTMTMQGNGRFSYRHFWEQGVYGLNRYWLQGDRTDQSTQMRLRNFTRDLTFVGTDLPERLRLEYELWSHNLCLGHYVMNLEIH